MDLPGAQYPDARPDGRFVALVPSQHLVTDTGIVPLPSGQDVLDLRLAPDGVRIAGIGHQDDQAWLWGGQAWSAHGVTLGPRSVMFDARGALLTVPGAGHPAGSQGYRYVDDAGAVVYAWQTYADPARHIWEYTTYGDVTIGQGGAGPLGDDPAIAIVGGAYRLLSEGCCRFINVHHDGDTYAIAWWRQDTNSAHVRWLTRAGLLALPVYVVPSAAVQPPVTPPVEPPKEPTHMENVFEFINAHPMRAILGTPKGPGLDNARAFNSLRFVNAVAADLNKRDGKVNWGIEKDTSGDHMPVINGQGYWADGLRTVSEGVDIVSDSEGEGAKPVWGDVGLASPDGPRGFRAPFGDAEIVAAAKALGLNLGTEATQEPPTKPPVTPPTGDSLEQRVAAIESQIAVLSTHMAADRAYTDSAIAGLDKHIAAQDKELSEHAELLDALMNDPTKSPTTPPATPSDVATEATLVEVRDLLAQIVAAINAALPGRKAA